MDLGAAFIDVLRTGVLLLITLTVLVAVHELGHYLVAKWCGMEVEAFAVMMGGIRKTNLAQYLAKPLAPAIWVWSAAAAAAAVWLLGVGTGNEVFSIIGLTALTFVIPAWIGMRLEALYHLPRFESLRKFGMCWFGALVLVAMGTRLQGLNPSLVLGVLLGGSMLGLLMVYYIPVSSKEEDTPQGQGSIEIPVREANGGSNKRLTVWFRPVLHWTSKSGTEFSLLALPLGGFARIKGMEPKSDGSEVNVPNGFYSKSPLKRLAVLFAGPLFSILLGILLLGIRFSTYGVDKPSELPIIGMIDLNGPGAKAGLQVNDRIVSIDGVAIEKFTQINAALRGHVVKNPDNTYTARRAELVVDRSGKLMTLSVLPEVDKTPEPITGPDGNPTGEKAYQARLVVRPKVEHHDLSFGQAFKEAAEFPLNAATQLVSMFTSIGKMEQMVGGPIRTAEVASDASAGGFGVALLFAGLLSISLGIMNLLPFPPLDGGQMVVAFVELFRKGQRLSTQMQQALQTVGFCAILALMATAFIVDIGRQSAPPKPVREWSGSDEPPPETQKP